MCLDSNSKENIPRSSDGMRSFYECTLHKEKHKHTEKQSYFHHYIEILYCKEGSITVLFGQKQINMKTGDMIYIAPNTIHNIRYETNLSEHYCIKLDQKSLNPLNLYSVKNISNIINNHLGDYEFFDSQECKEFFNDIQKLFEETFNLYGDHNFTSDLTSYANALRLISFIIQKRSQINAINLSSDFVAEVNTYLNKSYQTVTLKEISKHVGMSYSHFSKVFTENFGTNYSTYLNKIRVEKSIDMLINSDASITDIALMVGFSSTSHYIKIFKNIMNITPSKYRKIKLF